MNSEIICQAEKTAEKMASDEVPSTVACNSAYSSSSLAIPTTSK